MTKTPAKHDRDTGTPAPRPGAVNPTALSRVKSVQPQAIAIGEQKLTKTKTFKSIFIPTESHPRGVDLYYTGTRMAYDLLYSVSLLMTCENISG